MNAEEFNERVIELTTMLKPKDRRNLMVCLGDNREGTAAYLCVTGTEWSLVVPVGDCVVHAGSGRRIEVRPSWRDEGVMELAIGDNAGHDFRVRGFIEFPADADIGLTEVVA